MAGDLVLIRSAKQDCPKTYTSELYFNYSEQSPEIIFPVIGFDMLYIVLYGDLEK